MIHRCSLPATDSDHATSLKHCQPPPQTRFNTLRPQPTIVGWGLNIIGSRDSPQDSNMKLSALLNKLVTHPTALSGGPYQASRNETP